MTSSDSKSVKHLKLGTVKLFSFSNRSQLTFGQYLVDLRKKMARVVIMDIDARVTIKTYVSMCLVHIGTVNLEKQRKINLNPTFF